MIKTAPFNKFMITNSDEQFLNKLRVIFDEPFNTVDDAIDKLELDAEARVKRLLQELDIRASVKTDRKSLRVQASVGRTKYFTSHFGSILDMSILKKRLAQDLIEGGQCKIRFYVSIEPLYNEDNNIYGLAYSINWFGHGCD